MTGLLEAASLLPLLLEATAEEGASVVLEPMEIAAAAAVLLYVLVSLSFSLLLLLLLVAASVAVLLLLSIECVVSSLLVCCCSVELLLSEMAVVLIQGSEPTESIASWLNATCTPVVTIINRNDRESDFLNRL